MGMDSYIYKSSREDFEKYKKQKLKSNDIFSEECYWRNPYGLHQFIVQKFLNVGEDDNCVHIPLSKENIETIINELKSNPMFFEKSGNGMWDSEDTLDAIKLFTRLLYDYSDDVVITYYSWY